ncbi:MAG: RluA family pseudouridine synthase [Planctomycetes bacterium]|nr:RluA family pseudouridine synthase [Planctomycetota bacterium]
MLTPPAVHATVDTAAAGSALLAWLMRTFRYHGEAEWVAHIAGGRVTRNGAIAAAIDALAAGDAIAFAPPPPPSAPPVVPIVHDDPGFVAVDKPAHLVCHRASAFPWNTFVPALEARLGVRLEPVHRLDRETSGVLLLTKDTATFTALQAQFVAGRVEKRYLALCHGSPHDDAFTIDAPIGRDEVSAIRDRRAVNVAGKPARTECVVLRRFAAHTLLVAVPRTGRTHQLRVHLAHAGLPIVGDKLYGRSDDDYLAWTAHLKAGGDPRARTRTLLHAQDLAFVHPRTGERLALHAAPGGDFARELASIA